MLLFSVFSMCVCVFGVHFGGNAKCVCMYYAG